MAIADQNEGTYVSKANSEQPGCLVRYSPKTSTGSTVVDGLCER